MCNDIIYSSFTYKLSDKMHSEGLMILGGNAIGK